MRTPGETPPSEREPAGTDATVHPDGPGEAGKTLGGQLGVDPALLDRLWDELTARAASRDAWRTAAYAAHRPAHTLRDLPPGCYRWDWTRGRQP